MTVKLFKKVGTYVDKKDGKEKRFVNFYVQIGDQMIPVEPKYFPQDRFEGRDPGFAGRKAVMEAMAETLPDKPSEGDRNGNFQ